MRTHPWRLILRSHSRSKHLHLPTPLSLSLSPPPHSSTPPLFHYPSFHRPFSSSSPQKQEQNPSERKGWSNPVTFTAEIFSKSSTGDEFKLELDSNDIVIIEDLVKRVLQHLGEKNPYAARRFFSYVLDREGKRFSEGSCYLMLGILRSSGSAKEHSDFFKIMRETRCVPSELEARCGEIGSKKHLRQLDVSYSSEMVSKTLVDLAVEEEAAMMFFRWFRESNLFEHDRRTYGTMLGLLGIKGITNKGSIETFWRVANEMRGAGFGMSGVFYVDAWPYLLPEWPIEDPVELYEFGMGFAPKPSVQHCSRLLRRVVGEVIGLPNSELDIKLFHRVL